MYTEQYKNPFIDQDTLNQLQPLCKTYNKSVVVTIIRGFLILISCFILAFFISNAISGFFGNIMAVIIIIAAAPFFFYSLKGLSKSENFITLQEKAEQLNTTANAIMKEYNHSFNPVPVTFLLTGIILTLGDISLWIYYAWHKATKGWWLNESYRISNWVRIDETYDVINMGAILKILFSIIPLLLGIIYLICYKNQRKRPSKSLRVLTVILLVLLALIAIPIIYIGFINGELFN